MDMRRLFATWGLDDVLRRHPGLSIEMYDFGALVLVGTISFTAAAPGLETIADKFAIRIVFPESFPYGYPRVYETGGRIRKGFHRLTDGSFCLGSPARVRLLISKLPTLAGFIDKCVIPYLYGYSYSLKNGCAPFGELAHGNSGLLDDYKQLFCVSSAAACAAALSLIGSDRRDANKQPCPCGSGRRLGRCHHRITNRLRRELGRRWCREEAAWIDQSCGTADDRMKGLTRLRTLNRRPWPNGKKTERAANWDSSARMRVQKSSSANEDVV